MAAVIGAVILCSAVIAFGWVLFTVLGVFQDYVRRGGVEVSLATSLEGVT